MQQENGYTLSTEKRPNTVIDLFAGCGGLSLGLHKAGWTGLFAIEKCTDAFATLKYNLIDKEQHFNWPTWLPQTNMDINDVLSKYEQELTSLRGTVDLVAGGPPCQGFSMAGRRNESDVRNKLINSYIKFIKLVQPQILLFENVKGFTMPFLKKKSKGITYSEKVISALKRLGYDVHGELINFGDFGIPQNRTRFILIGIKSKIAKQKGTSAKDCFKKMREQASIFLEEKGVNKSTKLRDAISDLLKKNGTKACPDSPNFESGLYKKGKLTAYQKLMRSGVKAQIPNSHRFARHNERTIQRFETILKESDKRNTNLSNDIKSKFNINKHNVIILSGKEKCPTITTLPDDYIHYCEPRILTVREYARIQSFPDTYEFKGKYTTGGKLRTKETPRYTQVGNAIPPLFGELCGRILQL